MAIVELKNPPEIVTGRIDNGVRFWVPHGTMEWKGKEYVCGVLMDGTPRIHCPQTQKTWLIDWPNLLALALKCGIDGGVEG